ncbi:MurR/RpiR family transcriptional regulator [Roseateles toxinivorans]|uniref:RpiR family transcriptional regulator n=1 Tax=Roseateles toxinivorans TaxID=270368 RepID=A0A4R6QFV1_9BURK|nr:MurR/RpiR family transcriptional regulator [Roseateles toxinivorans]TDP61270.1 RpiR family transcriptional regulator [Roseateles toxinivorans]
MASTKSTTEPTTPPHPFDRIREGAKGAPPALASVAQWMLRHTAQAATLSITDIAVACGSSPASVNRMARTAGYAGFAELKADLALVMRATIDPVQKLRDEQHRGNVAPVSQYVAMGRANVEQLLRDNTSKDIEAAARLLSTRGRIYVLGLGLTAHVCGWLADALTPYSHAVTALSVSGGTEQSASRMSTIGKGDVLVAISLPRYSRDTANLARFARERGAQVLAIIDSHAAPLANEADLRLFTSAAHPVLPSSYVAVQLLCEALVAEVMRRNPASVAMAAELTESIASQLRGGD